MMQDIAQARQQPQQQMHPVRSFEEVLAEEKAQKLKRDEYLQKN